MNEIETQQFEECMRQAEVIVARYRSECPEGFDPENKGGGPSRNVKMEKLQMDLLKKQLKESKMEGFEMPTLVAPPKAAPPPTMGSSDQVEAQQEQRRQSSSRSGYKQTLLAGETGGYRAPVLGASPTLLGGSYGNRAA